MKPIRRLVWLFLVALVASVGGCFGLASHSEIAAIAPPASTAFDARTIAKGEMLAAVGACAVCHTKPGGERLAGGFALPTPFGTIYSTNITPDPETGIGGWSLDAFRRAMRDGVNRDGDQLYPAFPYDHFTKTADEDIAAIYAYLMSQKPVRATTPANELGFPFNIRMLVAGWNLLFHEAGAFRPDPGKDAKWNRGAYLVQGLGHCSSCHTPRNVFGAEIADRLFGGGEAEGWHGPALDKNSPAPVAWSVDALVNYLIDGWDKQHGVAGGPMTPVVDNLSTIPEEEVVAMATYIASLSKRTPDKAATDAAVAFATRREFAGQAPPEEGPGRGDPAMERGAETFARSCANCHARGKQTALLALTGSVNAPDPRNAIRIVIEGVKPPKGSPDRTMPAFRAMPDDQLAELLAFTRAHFTERGPWPDLKERIAEARRGH